MGKICKKEECPCYNNPSPIFGPIKSGKTNQKILILTDAPESYDNRRIFSGEMGAFVIDALDKYGLAEMVDGSFLYATAIRCKADIANMSESMKNTALKCCKEFLTEKIQQWKPSLIISFGAMAMTQATKMKGIKDKQGVLVWSEEYQCYVLPMYAAGFLMRNMSHEGAWASGFNVAKNFIEAGWQLPTDDGKFTMKEVESIRGLFTKEQAADGIAIDTETQGLDWSHPYFTPVSYSVSPSNDTGYQIYLFEECAEYEKDYSLIWLRKKGSKKIWQNVHVKRSSNFENKIRELRWFLENEKIKKIMHNGSYDCHVFHALFRLAGRLLNWPHDKRVVDIRGYDFDTQNAAQLYNENMYGMVKLETLQKDFSSVNERYDSETFQKNADKSDMLSVPRELLTPYAVLDTIVTKQVSAPFKKFLAEEKELQRYMERMVMPTVNMLNKMEENGAYVDVPALEAAKIDITALRDKEHQAALDLIPKAILTAHTKAGLKLSRSALVRDTLFSPEGYKIEPLNITKSWEPSTDQDTLTLLLDKIRNKKAKDFIHHFKEYKKYDTLAGRYLSGFEKYRKHDGRIHSRFSICQAATGRSSCLTGDTLISVADFRRRVPIKDIQAGDWVHCFDDDLKPQIKKVVWQKKTIENSPVVGVLIGNRFALRCTADHLIRLEDGTYKKAALLVSTDRVLCSESSVYSVDAVMELRDTEDVYDIEVEDYHNFIANGVCVHNSSGPNVQNIPNRGEAAKIIRRIISVPKGKKILKADASQAELRWMSHYAQDRAMMKIFKEGIIDIHTATAQLVLGYDNKKWNTFSDDEKSYFRKQAKAINFGLLYGMSVQGYINYAKVEYGLDFTEEIGEQHRDGFFGTYRQLQDFYAHTVEYGKKHGYVKSALGRMRRLPELISNNKGLFNQAMRQAINFPIQSASSDAVLLAANEIMKMNLPPREFKLILFIHDELVAEVSEDCDINKYAKIMRDAIENPPLKELFGINLTVPLVSEVEFGDNLNDCKKWTFS